MACIKKTLKNEEDETMITHNDNKDKNGESRLRASAPPYLSSQLYRLTETTCMQTLLSYCN